MSCLSVCVYLQLSELSAHRLTQFSLNCDNVERLLEILQQVPHLSDLEYVHTQTTYNKIIHMDCTFILVV